MATFHHTTTATKRCTKCGEEKPATVEYFCRYKGGKDGLESRCKTCNAEAGRQWRAKNSDKVRERNRRWRAENPDKERERNRRWRAENPDKVREKNRRYRAKNPDFFRQWRAENPDKARAQKQRRRARKRSLPHTLTAAEWQACLEHFHHCCAYCGTQQSLWHVIEQEHVIPVSAGGAYTADNIVPACKSCNASKNDSEVGAWLVARFGKRKANAVLAKIRAYFDSLE